MASATDAALVTRGHPAAYAGVAFAALSMASMWLMRDIPSANASDTEITDFYSGTSNKSVVAVGLYLAPFAGIAFCWFVSALRHRIVNLAGAEDPLLSSMQLLSGVLFVAATYTAAAALAATSLAQEITGAQAPSPDTTRQLLAFGAALRMVFALRCAAVFMIAGTTRARRAGLMPGWLVVVSYLGALVLLLSASYASALTLVFPLWVALLSILVLQRHTAHSAAVTA